MFGHLMKRLIFTETKPDCVIFLQGSTPHPDILSFFTDSPCIATDGAANGLISLGVIPDIIIGDLDSFDPDHLPKHAHSFIIHIPDQEKNDFEKALDYCKKQEYQHILIYGIHGGDFEHSLNNVSVLWKYVDRFQQITIVDSQQRIAIPVFFDMICEELYPSEVISLIPFPHAHISTKGLEWNLENEVLELSKREGARNRSIGKKVSIEHFEGRFLFFCDARFPAFPVFTNYPSSFF